MDAVGTMIQAQTLTPSEFSRLALKAIEASEGRRKRRKRDTTPDKIGLEIKRELLERAADEDPAPEAFEAWLLKQALAVPASGPVRALCGQIMDEYRVAVVDPHFSKWLAEGAPSEDATEAAPGQDAELSRKRVEAQAAAGRCPIHADGDCPQP